MLYLKFFTKSRFSQLSHQVFPMFLIPVRMDRQVTQSSTFDWAAFPCPPL